MMLNLLSKFVSGYNKIRYLWLVIMVGMIVFTMMITLFASIGLNEVQKQEPNAFHGHYLNYNNLWALMLIWPPLSLGFILLGSFSLYLHKLPTSNKSKEESLK